MSKEILNLSLFLTTFCCIKAENYQIFMPAYLCITYCIPYPFHKRNHWSNSLKSERITSLSEINVHMKACRFAQNFTKITSILFQETTICTVYFLCFVSLINLCIATEQCVQRGGTITRNPAIVGRAKFNRNFAPDQNNRRELLVSLDQKKEVRVYLT